MHNDSQMNSIHVHEYSLQNPHSGVQDLVYPHVFSVYPTLNILILSMRLSLLDENKLRIGLCNLRVCVLFFFSFFLVSRQRFYELCRRAQDRRLRFYVGK